MIWQPRRKYAWAAQVSYFCSLVHTAVTLPYLSCRTNRLHQEWCTFCLWCGWSRSRFLQKASHMFLNMKKVCHILFTAMVECCILQLHENLYLKCSSLNVLTWQSLLLKTMLCLLQCILTNTSIVYCLQRLLPRLLPHVCEIKVVIGSCWNILTMHTAHTVLTHDMQHARHW